MGTTTTTDTYIQFVIELFVFYLFPLIWWHDQIEREKKKVNLLWIIISGGMNGKKIRVPRGPKKNENENLITIIPFEKPIEWMWMNRNDRWYWERERNNTHRIGVVGGGGGGGVYDRPILSIFVEEKMIFFSLLMSRCLGGGSGDRDNTGKKYWLSIFFSIKIEWISEKKNWK